MRPVPAQRIGYAHGLLRALAERGPARPDDLAAELPARELFPPELEEAGAARLPQLVSYARAAGLLEETEDGAAQLTDLGREYVAAGEAELFAVSPGQAELLRTQLRDNHMGDSIWAGAAIGLSLWSTVPEGQWVSLSDFARVAAHLGGADWDDENTLRAQGKRLTLLLQDMGLIDERRRLTETGDATRRELRLPMHLELPVLAGQRNPGGAEGAQAAADAEREQLGLDTGGQAEATEAAEAAEATEQAADSPLAPPSPAPGPPPPAPSPPPAPAPPPPATPAPRPAQTPPGPSAEPITSASGIVMRPTHTLTALRREDFDAWRAEHEAARGRTRSRTAKDKPFLDMDELRSAGEKQGLVVDDGVYAAAVAALAAGRHLVLTGVAGSGKTVLATLLAEAAVRRKHAEGFRVAGGAGLGARDILGRHVDGGFRPGLVPAAIAAGYWLVLDELERARIDRALGRVSTVLAGQAIDLPDGQTLTPPAGWRMITTMGGADPVGRASTALLRRFVFVEMPVLGRGQLEELVDTWSEGDEVAAAVGRRLAAVIDVVPLGPGLFRDAVSYVRARRRLAPGDEKALALEALAGFVLPQLEGAPEDVAARAAEAAGLLS